MVPNFFLHTQDKVSKSFLYFTFYLNKETQSSARRKNNLFFYTEF